MTTHDELRAHIHKLGANTKWVFDPNAPMDDMDFNSFRAMHRRKRGWGLRTKKRTRGGETYGGRVFCFLPEYGGISPFARYIAAADPATVLALLDAIARLEADNARLRGVVHQVHVALLARIPGSVPGAGEACEALLRVLYQEVTNE